MGSMQCLQEHTYMSLKSLFDVFDGCNETIMWSRVSMNQEIVTILCLLSIVGLRMLIKLDFGVIKVTLKHYFQH